jgi:hypothetical protein
VTLRTLLLWFGAIAGPISLVLQLYLTLVARLADGDSVLGALFYFVTFFTILSNAMMALCYVAALSGWKWLSWWQTPFARALTAGSIAMVSLYYIFFLSGLTDPTGLGQILNIYMHHLAPWLFVLWWLLTPGHGTLRYADVPRLLIYPLAYLVVVMIRGAFVNEYPYPILRANEFGYGQVALNCLFMLIGFIIIYVVTVAVDRWLGRRRAASA